MTAGQRGRIGGSCFTNGQLAREEQLCFVTQDADRHLRVFVDCRTSGNVSYRMGCRNAGGRKVNNACGGVTERLGSILCRLSWSFCYDGLTDAVVCNRSARSALFVILHSKPVL